LINYQTCLSVSASRFTIQTLLNMKVVFTLALSLLTVLSFAQSFVGTWKTIDDNSGEARSYVEIYEENGQLFGKIAKLLDVDPSTVCDQCPGKKKNTPLIGLVIIENMKPYQDYWKKGKILDPESGSEYGCSFWIEDGALKVRGKHWTGLYRTQTWYPVE